MNHLDRNHPMKLLITILIAVCASASARENVYMPFFELINVHQDYQYSSAKLFKTYVEEAGRFQVTIPPQSDTLTPPPPLDSLQALCLRSGFEKFITGEMNRVGETVIISFSLYRTSDIKLLWSDHLKAANPEDIDPILQKVARAIGTDQKAAQEGDIYSVTIKESQPLKQVRTNRAIGVAIGGAGLPGKNYRNNPFIAGAGVFGFYDTRDFLFELDGHVYGQGDSHLMFFSLATYRPLYARNVTPFFGGGLGIMNTSGTIEDQTDPYEFSSTVSKGGLMLFAGGGLLLNRTSNVQIRLNGRYFVGAFKINGTIPNGMLFNLALSFGS